MEKFDIDLQEIELLEYNTVIIGTGAAALNCAIHLVEEGIAPWQIALVTEELGGGTSFNAGSDKQTYYKLSIIGDQADSPFEMAKDLTSGGAMHGDIALIESTNSLREFFHLVQLGVSFEGLHLILGHDGIGKLLHIIPSHELVIEGRHLTLHLDLHRGISTEKKVRTVPAHQGT